MDLQEQLSQAKQKCSELSSQLQSASSDDTVHISLYEKLQREMGDLKVRLERQKEALLEKDRSYEDMQLRLSGQEERESLSNSEITSLRKQVCTSL